jgi:glycosyltransferase involved in cell wall biosynthesis
VRIAVPAHLLEYPPASRTGVGTYIRNLLTALPQAASTDHIEVFWGRHGRQLSHELPAASNMTHHFSALPLRARVLRVPYERVGLSRAVRAVAADVLHLPDPAITGLPSRGRRPRYRTVTTVQDLTPMLHPDSYGTRARYKSAVIRSAVRHADMIVAASNATRSDILEQLGADPERVVTVAHGVAPCFRPVSDADEVRTRFGLPPHFLLSVGRLDPRKNLVRLFEAFAGARAQGLRAPLFVVGQPGWLYDDILRAPARLGIADDVVFMSHVPLERLVAMYATSDAVVYPSLYEGFGLPVLEAMACGAPVITSDVSSLPEVAGDAALFVDPLDTTAIAAAITRVTSDEGLRQKLRHAGLRRASLFTWERTARETLNVYERALQT